MAAQERDNPSKRSSCLQMFALRPDWPLGCKLSSRISKIKPYIKAELYGLTVQLSQQEGQN